jgi:oxysterol-binding protein-related protein 1/2
VSHHPPVACYHGEGPGYDVAGEVQLVSSFWGKAITVKPAGGVTATLAAGGGGERERYAWRKPTVSINNIIIGKIWSEPTGTEKVECSNGARFESLSRLLFAVQARLKCRDDHRIPSASLPHRSSLMTLTSNLLVCSCSSAFAVAGYGATMTFEKCKGDLAKRGRVHGAVTNARGALLYTLAGSMLDVVAATPHTQEAADAIGGAVGIATIAFERPPDAPEVEAQFNMTPFAIQLNDDADAAEAAPTDSRRRPDMRLLENAQFEAATREKVRLEEAQREANRRRVEASDMYAPRWFARSVEGDHFVKKHGLGEHVWQSNGEYWAAREQGEYGPLPDIYCEPV